MMIGKTMTGPKAPGKDDGNGISPLAPKNFPALPKVAGVQLRTKASGEKYKGRDDLLLVKLAKKTAVAGVFTKSATRSAAVDWCQRLLSKERPQGGALIVNAGNANAFTGGAGQQAVKEVVREAAQSFGCPQTHVFVASTGVIGEPLDTGKIIKNLSSPLKKTSPNQWEKAAKAIMTTDTFAKGATVEAQIGSTPIVLAGIAKGSGMIAPDMATMLSFVFTDAPIPASVLQSLLRSAVRDSFNAITVDSDTSTSDTVLVFATGQAKVEAPIESANDRRLADFKVQLKALLQDLAHQIVRDGEGATKFVTVRVDGAKTNQSARKVALAVANSPLVKTAIAGEDANWGRVVMAVGKAGEPAERDLLSIRFGDHQVALKGQRSTTYDESVVSKYMQGQEIDLSIDLGIGKGSSCVWTCDLTHQYISINADYRS
jgi:glutamate N-acetyltransferase/amino-acid N-acetyltransferase